MHIYYAEVINVKFELTKKDTIVLLDSLIQTMVFEDSTKEVAILYNKILKQTDIYGYEKIYL